MGESLAIKYVDSNDITLGEPILFGVCHSTSYGLLTLFALFFFGVYSHHETHDRAIRAHRRPTSASERQCFSGQY